MPQKKLEDILSQEELDYIIDLYQNNVSMREIEKQVPYGRASISRMLERLGIKNTSGNHYRKYFFDFDFFEKIDTEKKAYWLGFLYADGCILSQREYGEQEFKLALAQTDEQSIIDFKKDLKSTYPVRYDTSRSNKNEKNQVQVIQSLRSQKTVDDLKRLGCVENKSLILTFPSENQVPKNLIYHFIRGYFDGDGSISSYKDNYTINFVGTEAFIKELYNYFQMGSVFPDKRKKNSWYLTINGNLQVLKCYQLMYNNATRFMERKYNKFQSLANKYLEREGI